MKLLDLTQLEGRLFMGEWHIASESKPVLEPARDTSLFSVGLATPTIVGTAARIARNAQFAWAHADRKLKAGVFGGQPISSRLMPRRSRRS